MSPVVAIDGATGALVVGGEKLFPIGLTLGPPVGSKTPAGRDGLDEVAVNGVNFVRTGVANWGADVDGLIAAQKQLHQEVAARGLYCWLWLGTTPNLPPPGGPPSQNEQLLTKIVNAFRNDAPLLAYKGVDEPLNSGMGADNLVRAYSKVKSLDPGHPLVIVQAPRGTVAQLSAYRPAFDVYGVDIYPVAYPPGLHSDLPNRDVNVVGDVVRRLREASGGKPFWTTLQVAWSGIVPTQSNPTIVPRFPTLQQERFMAYEAIVNGARGLNFFGGHLTTVMVPGDAASGWNWTFWRRVLRPVVSELASPDVQPALVAPTIGGIAPRTSGSEIELVARRTATHLYVIAVRIGGSVSQIEFAGLPARNDGSAITTGEVLAEPVQDPLPPPSGAGAQLPRRVSVTGGVWKDWFAPHDAHVYRFAL